MIPKSSGSFLRGPIVVRPNRCDSGEEILVDKEIVRTHKAPAPFEGAPYNQAVKAAGLIFVAGQVGLKPGETALEGDVSQQTEQALSNISAILEAAGSSMEHLVKTTVFLQDLGDFQAMNEVYARRVGERPPARSTVQVAQLPAQALVEIEVVALS